jgi:hypothetical protein
VLLRSGSSHPLHEQVAPGSTGSPADYGRSGGMTTSSMEHGVELVVAVDLGQQAPEGAA